MREHARTHGRPNHMCQFRLEDRDIQRMFEMLSEEAFSPDAVACLREDALLPPDEPSLQFMNLLGEIEKVLPRKDAPANPW